MQRNTNAHHCKTEEKSHELWKKWQRVEELESDLQKVYTAMNRTKGKTRWGLTILARLIRDAIKILEN